MATNGRVVFPNRDSAEAFLRRFAPTVTRMRLQFDDLRVEPLAPGLAIAVAGSRERILMVDSSAAEFGGAVTALVRHGTSGWHRQHLHWSSPAP